MDEEFQCGRAIGDPYSHAVEKRKRIDRMVLARCGTLVRSKGDVWQPYAPDACPECRAAPPPDPPVVQVSAPQVYLAAWSLRESGLQEHAVPRTRSVAVDAVWDALCGAKTRPPMARPLDPKSRFACPDCARALPDRGSSDA